MTNSLSADILPAVDQVFDTLDHLLVKVDEHAKANDIAETVYLDWRIAPDMFPLASQFRFATEIPARALTRLAGEEIPTFADDEKSFAELRARIERVRAIVGGVDVAALDANPDEEITVPMGPAEVTFGRAAYARYWMMPNLYFHTSAAYLILRQLGVDLGKRDYLVALARQFGQ